MGTTPLNELISAALSHSPSVPGQVLRGAFQAATHESDRDLLRALIRREDAPADLVEVFAGTQDPTFVGIFLARAPRPGARAVPPGETRAAILARALAAPTVSAETFRDAMAAFERKPTQTLCDQLRRLPAAWFTPEQAAAVLLAVDGTQTRPTDSISGLVRRLGPEHADRVIRQVRSTWLLDEMVKYDLPVDAIAHAIRAWAPTRHGKPLNYAYSGDNSQHTLADAFAYRNVRDRHALQAALLRDTTGIPSELVGIIAMRGYIDKDAAARPTVRWDRTPATPPQPVSDLGAAPVEALRAIAAGGTAADLSQVVNAALQGREPNDVARVAAVALVNPNLTTRDRHRLVDAVCAPAFQHTNPLENLDLIALHPEDGYATHAWAAKFPCQALRLHGWAPFGGPSAAAAQVQQWEIRRNPDNYEWMQLITAVAEAGLTRHDLRQLQPQTVQALCSVSSPAATTMAVHTAALLAEGAGEQSETWRALATLSVTFSGSLGELIDTARSVSG